MSPFSSLQISSPSSVIVNPSLYRSKKSYINFASSSNTPWTSKSFPARLRTSTVPSFWILILHRIPSILVWEYAGYNILPIFFSEYELASMQGYSGMIPFQILLAVFADIPTCNFPSKILERTSRSLSLRQSQILAK